MRSTDQAFDAFLINNSVHLLIKNYAHNLWSRSPQLLCFVTSVAKCPGSWVVGRGRGSWVWVWVNVVGKKKKVFQKEKKKIKKLKAKSCKFHETKIFAYMSALLPFTAVSKLKQISESFSTNRHYNKRDSVHYVNLKQAIENWRLNCFF